MWVNLKDPNACKKDGSLFLAFLDQFLHYVVSTYSYVCFANSVRDKHGVL